MKNTESVLISVIVPAYNVEEYISRCVGSILEQTHRRLEVIVVNDGSTDDTGLKLDRLAARDERIRVVHAENRGVHGARAAALKMAGGEFVGFVDADDWIAPGMYARLLEALLAEGADISVCGAVIATGPGETGPPKVRFGGRRVVTDRILDRFCGLEFGSGVLWNKLYQAARIREAGTIVLEREVDAAEDYIVNFGVFAGARKVVTLPGFDYFYFAHPASASRRESNARSFCRTLRAYVVCLENYAAVQPDGGAQIDRLYAIQLRMDAYRVGRADDFDQFRDHLEQSMQRLVKVHPAGVHALVNVFNPEFGPGSRGLRKSLRRLLAAARELGAALTESLR